MCNSIVGDITNMYLRLLAVHVQRGQFIVNKFHSYSRQRGLLLKLADSSLDVLHYHLGISVNTFMFLTFLLYIVNAVKNVYKHTFRKNRR